MSRFLSLLFFLMQRLEAKLVKKLPNGLEVSILPDEIHAVVPTVHLSDHMSNCSLLWENLQEGDLISKLVCFNKNKQNVVSFLIKSGLTSAYLSERSIISFVFPELLLI